MLLLLPDDIRSLTRVSCCTAPKKEEEEEGLISSQSQRESRGKKGQILEKELIQNHESVGEQEGEDEEFQRESVRWNENPSLFSGAETSISDQGIRRKEEEILISHTESEATALSVCVCELCRSS